MLEVTRKNPFIFYVFFNKEKFQVDTSNIHVNLKVHKSQCPNSSTLDFCSESSDLKSFCFLMQGLSILLSNLDPLFFNLEWGIKTHSWGWIGH